MSDQSAAAPDPKPGLGYELLDVDPRRLGSISIKRRLRPGHLTLAESRKPLPFFGAAPGRLPSDEPVLLVAKVAPFSILAGTESHKLDPIAERCLAEEETWARAEGLFHSAGEDATYRWVARRFIPGIPLDQLDAGTSAEAKRLYAEFLLAELAQIHAAGEMHLDIKPSNVIATATRTWLIDFESSRDLDQNSTLPMLTTDTFASPEQILGRPTGLVGPASDIFSWALTVVSLFRPRFHPYCDGPFDRVRLATAAEAADHVQPLLDLSCVPDPALREAVRRALVFDPKLRPSAAALRDQLAEHGTVVLTEIPVTVVLNPSDYEVSEPWWRSALRWVGPGGPLGDKRVPAMVLLTAYVAAGTAALLLGLLAHWIVGVLM